MAKPEPTLNRGEPETRNPFERAKDNFDQASGDVRITTNVAECPDCGQPMMIEKTYKAPDAYKMTGSCSDNPDHDIERFGYFSTETVTQ